MLRANIPRLLRQLQGRRRHFTTTAAAARYLRPFTVSALDTAHAAMEKSRQHVYAQWSQAELISHILELERSMET